MKALRQIVALLLCCLFARGNLSAQNQSISGWDFWVMIAERQSCFATSDTIVLYIFGGHIVSL